MHDHTAMSATGASTPPAPLLEPADVDRLRDALLRAGYTAAGIAARLGPEATAAAARNDLRGTLRATRDRDRLATLIRLFVAGRAEPATDAARALAPLRLDAALAAGILVDAGADGDGDGANESGGVDGDSGTGSDTTGGARVRAGVDLEPYGDEWWVVADLPAAVTGRQVSTEHVLGVGGASTTLAGATIRRPVGSALDLGTGCGVQALHLSTHATTVTATDLSPRALRFAATTAALSGQDWELLAGDMATPVRGRRFDLVVSNPPFVIGPGGTASYTYRDSGRPADGICAELAAAAPGLLTEGGTIQFLANWLHVRGADWRERVAGWFAGTGLDVWVIQREVTDPLGYVNLWQADAHEPPDPRRTAAWLDFFDAHRVEAVGFGLVTARRLGHDDPVVRLEDLRQAVEPPLGARVASWFDRREWLDRHPGADLLARRFRAAAGLRLRQDAGLTAEGWVVDTQALALTGDLRWAEDIDPLVLALVAGADATVRLADQLSVLAAAHGVAESDLAQAALPIVAHLVERGFLLPADG